MTKETLSKIKKSHLPDFIVCPYCAHVYEDSAEFFEDPHGTSTSAMLINCESCNRTFETTPHPTIRYETTAVVSVSA